MSESPPKVFLAVRVTKPQAMICNQITACHFTRVSQMVVMTEPPTADYRNGVDLLRSVAQADESAVAALYRANANPVFRFVYRRVGEKYEDAEEITQDTFVSALGMAATFRGDSTVFTWLCGIAKLRITDFYRKQNRDKRIPSGQISTLHDDPIDPKSGLSELVERISASQVIDSLLSLVTEDERQVMLLRYVEQLSVREICTLMDRTEKGVESLLSRAKSKLREAISLYPAT